MSRSRYIAVKLTGWKKNFRNPSKKGWSRGRRRTSHQLNISELYNAPESTSGASLCLRLGARVRRDARRNAEHVCFAKRSRHENHCCGQRRQKVESFKRWVQLEALDILRHPKPTEYGSGTSFLQSRRVVCCQCLCTSRSCSPQRIGAAIQERCNCKCCSMHQSRVLGAAVSGKFRTAQNS